MFALYYNFIKPTEADFSSYKKAKFIVGKVGDYKNKYSKDTRKRCYELIHGVGVSADVISMTDSQSEAELEAIHAAQEALDWVVSGNVDDHEKYISNLQEFKYDKKELCFTYNGTLQEKDLNFYCERTISTLEQKLPPYRFYQYFNSFIILIIISLILFLFRKWWIWLVRA